MSEPSATQDQGFAAWCLVELFGHQRISGYLSEQQIGGQSFIRVDVPETSIGPGYSKFFGSGAIYSFTPVDEAIARGMAERLRERPISVYELQKFLLQPGSDDMTAEPVYKLKDNNDDMPF